MAVTRLAIEPQFMGYASRRAALVGAVGFAAAIAMPSANAATSVQHSAQLLRAKVLWETHWAAYRPLEGIEDAREYERLHAEIAAENKPRWTEDLRNSVEPYRIEKDVADTPR